MQEQRSNLKVYGKPRFWLAAGLCLLALAWPALAQQTTYTYDKAGNTISIRSGPATAPAIIRQPLTRLLVPNQPMSLSVAATGLGNSYQWLSNGVPVLGANNATLILSGLANTNGMYSVVISNSYGSVTSSPAALWADTKGSGMPDWWQLQYFGNLNQPADGDYDGDGVNNLDEYLEGTNPTNALSYDPRLTIQASSGVVVPSPSRPYYTMGQVVTLTVYPGGGPRFLGWSGPATGTKPTISLIMNSNITETANFGLPLNLGLENTNLFCTTGGDAAWTGQTQVTKDGVGAARTGIIQAGQQSWLQAVTTNLTQAAQLGFWWNVSSQAPDALSFSLDGNVCASITGNTGGWQMFQTNLTIGTHVFLWTYAKNPNGNAPTGESYTDAGWVDGVTITNSP